MTYPAAPRTAAESERYNEAFDQDWLDGSGVTWGGQLNPIVKARQILANARAAQRGAHGRAEQPARRVRGDGPGDGDPATGGVGVRRHHRGEARARHPEVRPGIVASPRHDGRAADGAGGHVQLPLPRVAGVEGAGRRQEPAPVVHADREHDAQDRPGVVQSVGSADPAAGDPRLAGDPSIDLGRERGRSPDGDAHR